MGVNLKLVESGGMSPDVRSPPKSPPEGNTDRWEADGAELPGSCQAHPKTSFSSSACPWACSGLNEWYEKRPVHGSKEDLSCNLVFTPSCQA